MMHRVAPVRHVGIHPCTPHVGDRRGAPCGHSQHRPAVGRVTLSRMSSAAEMPPPPDRGYGRWLPGLWTLLHYRAAWLPRDVLAGLVLTAILVPTGMGYAEAAGLEAITGLYAT